MGLNDCMRRQLEDEAAKHKSNNDTRLMCYRAFLFNTLKLSSDDRLSLGVKAGRDMAE